jgi:hypothetical protein
MFNRTVSLPSQLFSIYCLSAQRYVYPASEGMLWYDDVPRPSMSGETQAECEHKWLMAKRRVGKNLSKHQKQLLSATEPHHVDVLNRMIRELNGLRDRLDTDFITVIIKMDAVPI